MVSTDRTAAAADDDLGDDDLDAEIDAEVAEADEAMRRAGISDEEIARIRGRSPGDAPQAAVPSRREVERELAEIEALRKSDKRRYYSDEVQARQLKLIEMREQLDAATPAKVEVAGATDGTGITPELLDQWEMAGGAERRLAHAQQTAQAILEPLDDGERESLVTSFDRDLPEAARTAVYDAISYPGGSGWRPASQADVDAFGSTEEGAALVAEWGSHAARNVGIVRGRVGVVMQMLSPADRAKAQAWIDGLSSAQAKAVWRALVPAS